MLLLSIKAVFSVNETNVRIMSPSQELISELGIESGTSSSSVSVQTITLFRFKNEVQMNSKTSYGYYMETYVSASLFLQNIIYFKYQIVCAVIFHWEQDPIKQWAHFPSPFCFTDQYPLVEEVSLYHIPQMDKGTNGGIPLTYGQQKQGPSWETSNDRTTKITLSI